MVARNEVEMSRSEDAAAAGCFHHGFASNRKITFVTLGKVVVFVPGGCVTVQPSREEAQIEVFDHFAAKYEVLEG